MDLRAAPAACSRAASLPAACALQARIRPPSSSEEDRLACASLVPQDFIRIQPRRRVFSVVLAGIHSKGKALAHFVPPAHFLLLALRCALRAAMVNSAVLAAPTVRHAHRDWRLSHMGTAFAFLLREAIMAAAIPVCGTIHF